MPCITPPGDFIFNVLDCGHIRAAVLDALNEHAPRVIQELRDDVFPLLKTAPDEYEDYPTWEPYRQWAQRNRVEWDWMPAVAWGTLVDWLEFIAKGGTCIPGVDWSQDVLWVDWKGDELKSRFDSALQKMLGDKLLQAWSPDAETRADAEKRLASQFNAFLRSYHDALEAELPLFGLVRVPRKHNLPRHAGWFVRHHVLGETFYRIAKSDGCDKTTVSEAVRKLSAMLPNRGEE